MMMIRDNFIVTFSVFQANLLIFENRNGNSASTLKCMTIIEFYNIIN